MSLDVRADDRRCRGGRLLVGALATLPLAGCEGGVLDPQGPVGAAERIILYNSLAIMLAIVIPTIIAILAFAWWFRAGNARARFRPDFVYSGRIELIVWSIPTLVIIFLGGVIWIGSQQLDPAQPLAGGRKPLEVQVVSLDWKWLFIYPDQNIASVNELVVPAGQPVHFTLTSASVMTAFFVPQLGSMIYTMNGMQTQLHLQADRPGDYFGQAAHFSGDGFPDMTFTLKAVSDDAFQSWIGAAQAQGPALDRAAYQAFARQSSRLPVATWRNVDPGLFQAIVTQAVPPAPGPGAGRGGPDVSPRPGG
jgi:cytochrome o ubiquinol oxidase subunit II